MIKLDFTFTNNIDWKAMIPQAKKASQTLKNKTGAGNEYLGWLDLPKNTPKDQLNDLIETAQAIQKSDLLVSIGIGGSYLGAKAVINALSNEFAPHFRVIFAGHHMDSLYHKNLLDYLDNKKFALNVISKSGTTTEPGLAFRLLWNEIPDDQKQSRIIVTTDSKKGSLRTLADSMNLKSFIIPDDVGGRFSVFTPVGLLPVAVAGLDIEQLINGAAEMSETLMLNDDPDSNPAIQYACYRNASYQAGKKIEIMASYQQSLSQFGEWWKQLFGESEGKNGKGIFPTSVSLSTDLHSMGQWIQDAERSIFETVLDIEEQDGPTVPKQNDDTDQLNYLAGRKMHSINRAALQSTLDAHQSGGVPCLRISIPKLDEFHLGGLLYMMEYSCGLSAYMLGVNPFDQPGVEAYKIKMFEKLGKPGYT